MAASHPKTRWQSRADAGAQALSSADLDRIDAWWRAANYLSVGQIYLLDNPLLRRPLTRDHVKPRLLGHWGTTPGLNFLYADLNRAIAERAQSTLYITGPGHGGPGLVANTYLEGSYTEHYHDITQDEPGLKKLFKQFSFPGGIPSHVAPETPGSIYEGGELGYALSHAYGAAFDNPDLLVFAVVGDGEAETGPLATSWHSNKFVNPVTDGVVLPVLHLNGYKIANPTVLARIGEDELTALMHGYGHRPYLFTAGFDEESHASIHGRFAALLDELLDEIATLKATAAAQGAAEAERPLWPMIVFRTPKGWTGPKEIDGKPTEGHRRSHQVPLANARDTQEHLRDLVAWLESYRADELFDADGRLREDIASLAPAGELRMGANSLLATWDHVLRTEQYVNVVVAGKQLGPSWLSVDEATKHCARGLGIWEWAGTEVDGQDPDVVLGCAGDIPTIEVLAAAKILRDELPEVTVRVVNVVDLMRLQDEKEHPHGLSNRDFDTIFTDDRPVIFAYHGYPWLIHRLTYRRHGHANIHVRGYKEEGTTTTPFDMVMLNDLDRYHLVMDVIDRVPSLGSRAAGLRQRMADARLEARMYAREHGEDIPVVNDWVWGDGGDVTELSDATLATGGDNE